MVSPVHTRPEHTENTDEEKTEENNQHGERIKAIFTNTAGYWRLERNLLMKETSMPTEEWLSPPSPLWYFSCRSKSYLHSNTGVGYGWKKSSNNIMETRNM